MRFEPGRTPSIAAVVVVLFAGSVGVIALVEDGDDTREASIQYVPLDDDRLLWLYTSRGTTFAEPTLSLNAIVYGNPEDVERFLFEGREGNWNETTTDEQGVSPDERVESPMGTDVEWAAATGSNRFVYVSGQDSGWLAETFQIHDGDYLGSRHHVRAYTPSVTDAEWTAMQAHQEYWDWFRARHIVTGIDRTQSRLEGEFADTAPRPEIRRIPATNAEDGGFDRWLTVVDFRDAGRVATVLVPLALFGAVSRRRFDLPGAVGERDLGTTARSLLVSLGIVAILMSVRLTGIGLERVLDVPPKSIAFLLYPFVFAGLPIGAFVLARPLDRSRAFSSASLGFLIAIMVDYTFLGVSQIAVNTIIHLGTLAVALGLIAIGSTRSRQGTSTSAYARLGVLLWVTALLLPLVRHLPLPL